MSAPWSWPDKRSTQGLCLEAHPYSAFDPLSEARTHTAGFSSKHTTVYHIPETEYNGPRRLSVVATVYLARLATTGPRVEGPGDQKRPCFPCIIVLPVHLYCVPFVITMGLCIRIVFRV